MRGICLGLAFLEVKSMCVEELTTLGQRMQLLRLWTLSLVSGKTCLIFSCQ